MMGSFNGFGTTLYGKRELAADGSYIATEWFILFWLPLFPISSYRIWSKTPIPSSFSIFIKSTAEYKMSEVPPNKKQIINTYLAVWGTIAALVIVGIVSDYLVG